VVDVAHESEAARGLRVYLHLGRVFTTVAVSLTGLLRQQASRDSIHAGP